MASIVSSIVIDLMNKVLSNRSVNWFRARRHNYPQMLAMDTTFVFNSAGVFIFSQGINHLPGTVTVDFTNVVGPLPNK